MLLLDLVIWVTLPIYVFDNIEHFSRIGGQNQRLFMTFSAS